MRIGTINIEQPPWFPRAACRGDRTWWKRTDERRQAVCDTCPVIDDCLTMALADPTLQGTWGGTTDIQRDQIRTRRRTA